MAIYKIFSSQDASIYSKFPAMNTGLDEILEVSVKNSEDQTNSLVAGYGPILSDDLRRSIIKFSDVDLDLIKQYASGSWKTYLKLYIANAENLSTDYTLEIRQVSQSWSMGTGHFGDSPQTRNGVCWYNTSAYYSSVTDWINPSYYLTSGGGSWTNTFATQSFNNESSKDVEADVTSIVSTWFNDSAPNNGFLIKHPTAVENNSGSYIAINFFSNDTHTIYPPTLEMRWDDSVYITGSLSVLSDSNSVVTLANNLSVYKTDTTLYKFRVNARDKYPTRVFTTSSLYTTNKRLPQTSYWSLIDAKTNDIVIDFDDNYTKISCDGTSSYFNMYMNGLEPDLPSGEKVVYDNDYIFKVIN